MSELAINEDGEWKACGARRKGTPYAVVRMSARGRVTHALWELDRELGKLAPSVCRAELGRFSKGWEPAEGEVTCSKCRTILGYA